MNHLDTISGPSVLHIKCDKRLHIAIKVEAMKAGKSMNQYVVDVLEASLLPDKLGSPPAPEVKSGSPGVVYKSTPSIPQPTPVKQTKAPTELQRRWGIDA